MLLLSAPGTFGKECFIGSARNGGFFPSLTTASIAGIAYALVAGFFYTEICTWLVRRSFVEDEMMKSEFGKEWEEWAGRVRWRVLPYVL